jgi:hypothetical protein
MAKNSDYALNPVPREITRRGWGLLAIVAAVALGILAFVLYFYDAEGGSRVNGGVGTTSASGLIATLDPQAVDPGSGKATIHLVFTPQGAGLVDDKGRMVANARVVVVSSLGVQEAKFMAGDPVGQFDAVIGIDGEEANYPFDVHTGFLDISAETFVVDPDGSEVSGDEVAIGVQGLGGVNGWDTTMDLDSGMSTTPFAVVTFHRAFSTQVFALLLLGLSVILALCSVVAGVLVGSNRRRLEVTMLSWAAALLFALPLLRNYLPNAPPVGASIDIYVYLWVIVAAVTGLVMLVVAWIRQKRAELLHDAAQRAAAAPPREPGGAPR